MVVDIEKFVPTTNMAGMGCFVAKEKVSVYHTPIG